MQIIYEILTGIPNFTATISPAISSPQELTSLGVYSFDGLPDGNYTLSVIDSNGCTSVNYITTTSTSTTTIYPCILQGTIDCNYTPDCILEGSIECDYTTTTTTTTTIDCSLAINILDHLELTFDTIESAAIMIGGDPSILSNWNTFFNLPSNGTPFNLVIVERNTIKLYGGSGITTKEALFANDYTGDNTLISVADYANCLITISYGTFYYCTSLTTCLIPAATSLGTQAFGSCISLFTTDFSSVISAGSYCFGECSAIETLSFPVGETFGSYCFVDCIALVNTSFPSALTFGSPSYSLCFQNCSSLISINLPVATSLYSDCFNNCGLLESVIVPNVVSTDDTVFSYCISLTHVDLSLCSNLGGTVGDNHVFGGVTGNTIDLYIPVSRMTCNGGNPDGDIQYLQANNTVTIHTI